MISAEQRLLVVAPHGLDEVLGAGGTMAALADAGALVSTLILFGDGSGRDTARRQAAAKATTLLGGKPLNFGGFPENRGDTVPLVDLVGAIEAVVADVKPTIVLVPHSGCLHVDHRVSHQAALTALRPVPRSSVRMVAAYEILSSSDWAGPGRDTFDPSLYVDVAATIERKRQALLCYGDEMRPPPHARSIEAAMRLVEMRGSTIGRDAAEGFVLLRQIV